MKISNLISHQNFFPKKNFLKTSPILFGSIIFTRTVLVEQLSHSEAWEFNKKVLGSKKNCFDLPPTRNFSYDASSIVVLGTESSTESTCRKCASSILVHPPYPEQQRPKHKLLKQTLFLNGGKVCERRTTIKDISRPEGRNTWNSQTPVSCTRFKGLIRQHEQIWKASLSQRVFLAGNSLPQRSNSWCK